MRFKAVLPFFLALFGIAACQPVPQPFSHVVTGSTAQLDLPDSGGIVVLALTEAPPLTAAALAQAMVTALVSRNIPASNGSGNSRSYFLQGSVEDDGRDAAIAWTLYDPQGGVIETVRQSIEGTPVRAWAEARPALMERLADQAAPLIAALIQTGVPSENPLPAVHIIPVTGAPGAGNRQLGIALRRHLSALGLRLIDAAGAQDVTVSGTVAVTPPADGRQQATLDWRIIDANGAEIGKISQSNPVAAGSLDGHWGSTADNAAAGAAQGVDALIRQIDWRARQGRNSAPQTPATAGSNAPR